MAPVAATTTCGTQRSPSNPRGVDLRVGPADTRAEGTALSQQPEKHRLEAEKKRESRKLPSQAEKRREKRRWFDKIPAQRKNWEIHARPTTKRGQIHFPQSGSTGKLMGRTRLVGCHRVSQSSFEQDNSPDGLPYHTPYAWCPEDAEKESRHGKSRRRSKRST